MPSYVPCLVKCVKATPWNMEMSMCACEQVGHVASLLQKDWSHRSDIPVWKLKKSGILISFESNSMNLETSTLNPKCKKLQGSTHPDSFQHLNPVMQHIRADITGMLEHWCLSMCDTWHSIWPVYYVFFFCSLLPGFRHTRYEAQEGKGWLDDRWSWAPGQRQGQLSPKSMWHVHSGLPAQAWAM